MLIQSTSDVFKVYACNSIEKTSNKDAMGEIVSSTIVETAKNTEVVTISGEARFQLDLEKAKSSYISKQLHNERHDLAEMFAYDLAHQKDQPFITWVENGVHRFTATGEPITKESMARFDAIATQVLSERKAIYTEGKNAGLSDADIYDLMIVYMDRQPEEYQNHLLWNERTYGYSQEQWDIWNAESGEQKKG